MHTKLEMLDNIPSESLEGNMTVPSNTKNTSHPGAPDFYTLDEPIKDTIMRDLTAVFAKFYHVLYPKENSSLLKDWDLWGPLILCTVMATILQGSSSNDVNDNGPEFAQVFVMLWIGAIVVTVNSKLLGGNISFFQSVCVLGYCITPLVISLIICQIILLTSDTNLLRYLRFIITIISLLWASYAAYLFMGNSQQPNKKWLAVYPIILFYSIISWLVMSHS